VSAQTAVVVVTRNRRDELHRTLCALAQVRPRPPVVVVDNASTDGTTAMLRAEHPAVDVVTTDRNLGSAGRNLGVARVTTPYVAFCDDDSWWAPDALVRAERAFDRHPRLGLVTGRTLVGPEQRPDPINEALAKSPLERDPGLPGPAVLGFLACASIVRRRAFEQVGGFHPLLFFGAEETLLAWDLAAANWQLCYLDELVTYHHPSSVRPPAEHRRRAEMRNGALATWMRRPAHVCVRAGARLACRGLRDRAARCALTDALRRLPRVLEERRRVPRPLEARIRLLAEEAG
jgi:GT2 family glycosyltransferase